LVGDGKQFVIHFFISLHVEALYELGRNTHTTFVVQGNRAA